MYFFQVARLPQIRKLGKELLLDILDALAESQGSKCWQDATEPMAKICLRDISSND